MSTNDSLIKQWSTTPAANGTAPNLAPYGWQEGMAPSDVNDTARQQMADHRYQWQDAEWFCWGDTVSKASASTFKIAADVTSRYLVDRRVKIFDTATKYATIISSSYSAPDTTVGLSFDTDTSLGASFTAVALSILTPTNRSIPGGSAQGRNLIIGGNFDTNPWQRGTTFTGATNGLYSADRFQWIQSGTGVVDIKKTADAPTVAQAGFFTQNCLHVDVTTADASIAAGDLYYVVQKIEGYNFAQIAQRSFTLSFWVKSTKTGIFCVGFINSAGDRSYVAEYTVNTTDTWEKKTITVPASPSAGTWNYTTGIGLHVSFAIAIGSTFQTTAGTWQTGNFNATANQVNGMDSASNNFKIALVQVEAGSTATPFEVEHVSTTLLKCQRYWAKSYNVDVVLATNTSVGAFNWSFASVTATAAELTIKFPVTMRATPTMGIYSVAGTLGKVTQDDASEVNATATRTGQNSFGITYTNGAGRYAAIGHYVADIEI